jgi:hypothetical protein
MKRKNKSYLHIALIVTGICLVVFTIFSNSKTDRISIKNFEKIRKLAETNEKIFLGWLAMANEIATTTQNKKAVELCKFLENNYIINIPTEVSDVSFKMLAFRQGNIVTKTTIPPYPIEILIVYEQDNKIIKISQSLTRVGNLSKGSTLFDPLNCRITTLQSDKISEFDRAISILHETLHADQIYMHGFNPNSWEHMIEAERQAWKFQSKITSSYLGSDYVALLDQAAENIQIILPPNFGSTNFNMVKVIDTNNYDDFLPGLHKILWFAKDTQLGFPKSTFTAHARLHATAKKYNHTHHLPIIEQMVLADYMHMKIVIKNTP